MNASIIPSIQAGLLPMLVDMQNTDSALTANILLVDDNPAKLLALDSILDSLGQNLIKVHSGEEALKALLQQDFAVILLDVNMPGIGGFEVAELIRQRRRSEHTPIIFISAISRSDVHAFQGYALGAVDYIFTPIVPEALRAKVGVFVELHRMHAQLKQQAQLLQRTIKSVRGVINNLRPEYLEEVGLRSAMEWHLQEYQSRTKIAVQFNTNVERLDLDHDCSMAIFRIFQESLTNVARHAQASK